MDKEGRPKLHSKGKKIFILGQGAVRRARVLRLENNVHKKLAKERKYSIYLMLCLAETRDNK